MEQQLARFLVERGLVTTAQLEEAQQCQVVFGASLGTNLVELEYLTLDRLAEAVSAVSGLPTPPPAWLETPDPAAVKVVPRSLVERHKVLPLMLEPRIIHVAFMHPLDPGQADEVAFASGRRVTAYVLPELRMYYQLERLFGIKREVRYIDLGRQASRGRLHGAAAESAAPPQPASAPASGDLCDEETFASLAASPARAAAPAPAVRTPSPAPPSLPPPPAPPPAPANAAAQAWAAAPPGLIPPDEPTITVVEAAPVLTTGLALPGLGELPGLERALEQAADRDEVVEAALRLALAYGRGVVLFLVKGGMIEGFRAAGEVGEERAGSVFLPLDADSALAAAVGAGEPWRGLADRPLDGRLLKALGRDNAGEIALLPIRIRGRVVNLLYVDNGPDPVPRTAFAALRTVAELLSAGYERLILDQKRAG